MGGSSRALRCPPECSSFQPAFRPDDLSIASPSSAFLGVSPLIATWVEGVHSRGHPKPASFRPRRFARPRRLTPPSTSWVCFTPLPRPGFAPQGFASSHSCTSSSLADALVSLAPDSCHRLPSSARDVRPPSGPCSVYRSVAHRQGLAADSPVPLSSLILPRVFLCKRWCRLHDPSGHRVSPPSPYHPPAAWPALASLPSPFEVPDLPSPLLAQSLQNAPLPNNA